MLKFGNDCIDNQAKERQSFWNFVVEETSGVSLSPQTVSNILARLDAQVRGFHRRSLAERAPRFLFLDGMSCRIGRKEVRVLVAWGSDGRGRGELLGYRVARSESFAGWVAFVRDLENLGLSTRRLAMVTTDDCAVRGRAAPVVRCA